MRRRQLSLHADLCKRQEREASDPGPLSPSSCRYGGGSAIRNLSHASATEGAGSAIRNLSTQVSYRRGRSAIRDLPHRKSIEGAKRISATISLTDEQGEVPIRASPSRISATISSIKEGGLHPGPLSRKACRMSRACGHAPTPRKPATEGGRSATRGLSHGKSIDGVGSAVTQPLHAKRLKQGGGLPHAPSLTGSP